MRGANTYTCGSNIDCTHSNNVQGYLVCTVKVSKDTTIFNKDAKINWLMLFGISVVNISAGDIHKNSSFLLFDPVMWSISFSDLMFTQIIFRFTYRFLMLYRYR
uniref:Uncharacterized protein n=1 Tax=Populus davidiana TaxID=266767 RepID=A0A6M2EAG4_9ROSI